MPLTAKQQKFVEEYSRCLNASEAARRAGYSSKTAAQQGERLLRNVQIANALSKLTVKGRETAIADATERREFWTSIMREPSVKTADRLKAAELLGKSQGDFIDRHEITGKDGQELGVIAYLPANNRQVIGSD